MIKVALYSFYIVVSLWVITSFFIMNIFSIKGIIYITTGTHTELPTLLEILLSAAFVIATIGCSIVVYCMQKRNELERNSDIIESDQSIVYELSSEEVVPKNSIKLHKISKEEDNLF